MVSGCAPKVGARLDVAAASVNLIFLTSDVLVTQDSDHGLKGHSYRPTTTLDLNFIME